MQYSLELVMFEIRPFIYLKSKTKCDFFSAVQGSPADETQTGASFID